MGFFPGTARDRVLDPQPPRVARGWHLRLPGRARPAVHPETDWAAADEALAAEHPHSERELGRTSRAGRDGRGRSTPACVADLTGLIAEVIFCRDVQAGPLYSPCPRRTRKDPTPCSTPPSPVVSPGPRRRTARGAPARARAAVALDLRPIVCISRGRHARRWPVAGAATRSPCPAPPGEGAPPRATSVPVPHLAAWGLHRRRDDRRGAPPVHPDLELTWGPEDDLPF